MKKLINIFCLLAGILFELLAFHILWRDRIMLLGLEDSYMVVKFEDMFGVGCQKIVTTLEEGSTLLRKGVFYHECVEKMYE